MPAKHEKTDGTRKKGLVPALLVLILILCLAVVAGGWLLLLHREGMFPAAKSPAEQASPRVVILNDSWCTQLTWQTKAGMKTEISAALQEAREYTGEENTAIALSGFTTKGTAIFRDSTGTVTTDSAVTVCDRVLAGVTVVRFDALQYIVRTAAADGISVYWIPTDERGNALAADAELPEWEQKLVDKYKLTLLYCDNPEEETAALVRYSTNTGLTLASAENANRAAAAVQTGNAQGVVTGKITSLRESSGEAELYLLYASAEELPSLTEYWEGREVPQTLSVAYPTADNTTIYTDTVFVMGTSNPDEALTLNGEEVARYGTMGVWGKLLTLTDGDNVLTLQNGADTLTYTIVHETASAGTTKTPNPDGTAGKEAKGKKLRVTAAIASALTSVTDASSIEDTLYQGAVAEIVKVVDYKTDSVNSHGYVLSTGAVVRAANCEVLEDAADAAFTGCEVTENDENRCTELHFAGSGTPAVIHTLDGNTLTLRFLSASYEGELPQSSRFTATAEQDGSDWILTLICTEDDPLYGWAVNYDTDADSTVIFLKHTPKLSDDPDKPLAGITVMLDAGHGGSDNGAMGAAGSSAPLEKDVNLAVTLAAKYRLEQLGATVTLTRSDDAFPSLGDRVTALNEQQPDLFIALHHDSIELTVDVNERGGAGVYWFYAQGDALAENLLACTALSTGRLLRGSFYGYYYVTRSEICPAVLFENGFVTNPAEYEDCISTETLWTEGGAIAQAVYETIAANG